MTKKMIPCRVCGKMFEPCAYCQHHSDVWRWRNFACSLECAKIYIFSTEAYRDAQKAKLESLAAEKKGRKKRAEASLDEADGAAQPESDDAIASEDDGTAFPDVQAVTDQAGNGE